MNAATSLPVAAGRPGHRRGRLLAVLATTAATLALWVAAVPLGGMDLVIDNNGTRYSVGPVLVGGATLLASLAGWALLALLERFTTRARAAWTTVALVVLLFSLGGPLQQAVGATSTVILSAMHLLAAAVLIPMLFRTAGRSRGN